MHHFRRALRSRYSIAKHPEIQPSLNLERSGRIGVRRSSFARGRRVKWFVLKPDCWWRDLSQASPVVSRGVIMREVANSLERKAMAG